MPVSTGLAGLDDEAHHEVAHSQFEVRSRGGVNCPRCDPDGEGVGPGVDLETLKVVERKRDSEQQTTRILDVLDLEPGQVIADVGAGSGYFSYFFSELVGEAGQVWAVDIADSAIDYLHERIQVQPPPHPNIRVVHSREDDVQLEPESLDWAFLCNVHLVFEERANEDNLGLECLRSVYRALKPGGRVAVLEPELDVNLLRHFPKFSDPAAELDRAELKKLFLTAEDLAIPYAEAGLEWVESHEFLLREPGLSGYGGQVFIILQKPVSSESDSRRPRR